MKNKFLVAAIFFFTSSVATFAQQVVGGHFYGEDALLFSNFGINGSARQQALGGNYTALGADASNASGNPAGLGFYNRSELSITPFYNATNTSSVYQDTKTTLSNNNVALGQLNLILHFDGYGGTRKKSSALAISYSKQAYLPSMFDYNGSKIRSSMADYFAERATARGVNGTALDNEYDPSTGNADTPTAMAYQAYLIDPIKDGATTYQRLDGTLPTKQSGTYSTTGAVSQTSISYGANFDDKTYIGFGLGIANISYDYNGTHREDFTNAQVFNSFTFYDALSTRGTGINLSIGGIFKVGKSLQVGTHLITPTWYSVSETYTSGIDINTKPNTIPSGAANSIGTRPNDFNYNLSTPLRASAGATYFFGKSGLLTADAEFVGYSLMKVSNADDAGFGTDQKKAIQNTFNDVVNLKVGGEIRADAFRFRAGVNYRPSPYKATTDGINHSQTAFTAGAGYRSSNFFVDLAGVFGQNKSAFTPYELINKSNYSSAQVTANTTNIVLSIGTFF